MRGKHRQTWTAGLLTALLVAVPCAAWWAAGTRAVERDAQSLVESAETGAARQAVRLAERLHGRLDGVLQHESGRPFFEYARRYQDPQLSCDCATWVESPLARGPADPLLWAHFEINRQGILSVPSVPAETGEDAGLGPVAIAQGEAAETLRQSVGALARAAWAGGRRGDDGIPQPTEARADAVLVSFGDESALVDPFRWHTVEIGGAPRLVALRTVKASSGSRIQGFVISEDAVVATLPAEPYPAQFRPSGAGLNGTSAPLGLAGADWELSLETGQVLVEASLQASQLRRGFLRRFLGGTAAAVLSAFFLVGLVAQSERTAGERSRFAASAAHELRTPLAGIRLYGEMLADGLGDPTRQQEYARQVASEADRLGRVVSNVLGYSNLERGRLAVKPERGDLVAVVTDTVDRLRTAVESQGATLHLEVADEIPAARFDEDAVRQALANLIDNAERYARSATDRRIEVAVAADGAHVCVSVSDHGPGIDRAQRKRLFRPFDRGSDPDAPGGLGLGLAIVAQFAKSQGGSIHYEESRDGGSRFELRLPVDRG